MDLEIDECIRLIVCEIQRIIMQRVFRINNVSCRYIKYILL